MTGDPDEWDDPPGVGLDGDDAAPEPPGIGEAFSFVEGFAMATVAHGAYAYLFDEPLATAGVAVAAVAVLLVMFVWEWTRLA